MEFIVYNIFSVINDRKTSVSIPPEFRLIKDTYIANINNLISYYNNSSITIKNNHILNRILNDSHIPLDYDIFQYLSVATNRAPYIAKLYQLTSEINYGELHKGNFYHDCDEVLLYTEDYVDIDELSNWKHLQPVKVLKHGISDFSLTLPDGSDNNTNRDLTVISIDIILLLAMSRKYQEEQLIISNGESVGDTKQFIARYVIPNMLYSQTDIAIVNRLMNIFNGTPHTNSIKKHPLSMIDYSRKIDKVHEQVLKRISNANMRYDVMLKNIPTVTNLDANEALLMPEHAPTRQIWWSLLLSRLPYIIFLLEVGGIKGSKRNKDLISKLKVTIKRIDNDNVYLSVIDDEDVLYDIIDMLYSIETLIK